MRSTEAKSPAPASHAFIDVMKVVDRIAATDLPVLLAGESSTGKALVASMIHHRSNRRDQPFIIVDCGSVPAEWLEAELSAYVEAAGGGTLYFDEITETTVSLQQKLLHVLQPGETDRSASGEAQPVSVRVIAASRGDVADEVAAGKFSNDLFGCLSQVSIALPPLREQRADIPALAESFADRVYSPILPTAIDDWVTLSVIEGRYVASVLEHTSGNKQAAARVLAVDRKTLDRMIKRHHIDSEHVRALRVKATSARS